jgi:hypothetical protein
VVGGEEGAGRGDLHTGLDAEAAGRVAALAEERSHDRAAHGRDDLDTVPTQTRHTFRATLPPMATTSTGKTATPWGDAEKLEALSLPQRAGDKRFASVVELLVTERGERLVRFAYSTGGAVRRGPVTLRVRDLERLRTALADFPGLAEVLSLGSGGGA